MVGLLAKLTPPRTDNIYHRERLYRLMDDASSRPVLWITSPAGAGKTTLVTSYLQSNNIEPVWYQIDEGDDDVASFFPYLGQAAEPFLANTDRLPLFSPEYLAGISVFTRNYFRELYSGLQSPGFIIFDNYQEVSNNSKLHQVLQVAFSEIPEGINIIVISRENPPDEFLRLQASGLISHLKWKDIQLEANETEEICKLRKGLMDSSDIDYTKLHKQSQGWLAGLVLILENSGTIGIDAGESDIESLQQVFGYFAAEIFSKTDDDTQLLLLKTALLPKLSIENAIIITDFQNAESLLKDLTFKNYFILCHTGKTPSYEYHPLFKRFLIEKGKTFFPNDELTELRSKAAKLLEKDGYTDDAVSLLLSSGLWQESIGLILKHAKNLAEQGRGATLLSWFNKIPAEISDSVPWLSFWEGMCYIASDPKKSRSMLEKTFYRFKEQNDIQGQLISFCSIVDTYIYERSEMVSLDKWIDEVEDLINVIEDFTESELGIRVTCAMFVALIYRQPHREDILVWEKRARDIVLYSENHKLRLSIGNHLVLYYMWWLGDKNKAIVIVKALQPLVNNAKLPPLARITWKMIEAGYHWMVTGSGESSRSAQEGMDIGEEYGVHMLDAYILTHAVFSNVCLRNSKEADRYLDIMTSKIEQHRFMDCAWYYFLYAWNEVAKENYDSAIQYAELAVEHGIKSGRPFMIANAYIEYGTLLYRNNAKKEAIELIEKALDIGHAMNSTSIIHLAEFAKMEFEIIEHDDKADIAQIRKCLKLAKKAGELSVSWFSPTTLVKFYTLALDYNLEREFVIERIQKARLIPLDKLRTDWPYRVKFHTLGRFNFFKDDVPIKIDNPDFEKAIDLVKAIIAFGGRDVDSQKLCNALWPEQVAETSMNVFTDSLHCLQKLIGENVVHYENGRLSLNAGMCWVDVWGLEVPLNKLSGDLETEIDKDKLEQIDMVFKLYQGPFLSTDNDVPWCLSMREHLQQKLTNLILNVCPALEKTKQYELAHKYYQHGLTIDELNEQYYQGLMRCCLELGSTARGMGIYQRCAEVLHKHLNVNPSVETEALKIKLQDGLLSESIAKITAPHIQDTFERTRLFEKIDEARNVAKVIWVSAPAGSGKTTLIASYLQSKKLQPVWFQVDESDADMASFFYYLGITVKKHIPKNKTLPFLAPEYQLGIPAFTRNYFRLLFSALKKNAVLVLDNVHELSEAQEFDEIISHLSEEVSFNGQLVIISRNQFPGSLSRLHLNNQLTHIDWNNIQLTQEECEAISKTVNRSDLLKGEIKKIYKHTKGWMLGFLLALQNISEKQSGKVDGFDPEQLLSLGYQEELFDYFSNELFEKLSKKDRSILLKLAYLNKISVSTVNQLVGKEDSATLLSSLEKKNHFITKKGETKPQYEFHPLFRSFLRTRNEEKISKEKSMALMYQTANISIEHGDFENAAKLLIELEAWGDLTSLIKGQAAGLEKQGRHKVIASWINLLPLEHVEQDPIIIYWKGIATEYVNPFNAYDLFEKAFLLFEAQENWSWCYVSWLGIAETIFLRQDDYTCVPEWMKKLNKLREVLPEYPNEVVKVKITIEAFNLCNMTFSEKKDFDYWLLETERLYQFAPISDVRCIAGIRLSLYYAFFAKTDKLLSVSQTVAKFTLSNEVRPIIRVLAYWAELTHNWGSGRNQEQEARRLTDEAMKVSAEYGVHGADIWVYSAAIFNALVFGDLKTAKDFLEIYSVLGEPRQRLYYSNYLFLLGWYELATDSIKPAIKHLKEAQKYSSEITVTSFDLLNTDALVKAYILNDEYDKARELVKDIKTNSKTLNNDHYYIFKSSMVLAWINLKQNNLAEAKNELEKCFHFGNQEKCIAGGAWLHSMLADLCELALATGIEVDYAKQLISTYQLKPDNNPNISDDWPYPIKIFTLGRFSLLKDGAPIQSGKRASKKALDIIKAIIAFGGRDVNAEKLSSALWSDQDGDASMNAFTTTLHRLRKFIGKDVIHYENGCLSLNPEMCWVDIWGIEIQINKLNAKQVLTVDEKNLSQIDSILETYKGPFLSGDDQAHWHLSMRERLQQKITNLIIKLCHALEHNQDYERANKYYQYGLTIDDLNERFYQGQMRCCLEQGLVSEGIAVYQRCVDILYRCLNVGPSVDTETLRKQLMYG